MKEAGEDWGVGVKEKVDAGREGEGWDWEEEVRLQEKCVGECGFECVRTQAQQISTASYHTEAQLCHV